MNITSANTFWCVCCLYLLWFGRVVARPLMAAEVQARIRGKGVDGGDPSLRIAMCVSVRELSEAKASSPSSAENAFS